MMLQEVKNAKDKKRRLRKMDFLYLFCSHFELHGLGLYLHLITEALNFYLLPLEFAVYSHHYPQGRAILPYQSHDVVGLADIKQFFDNIVI